LPEISIYTVRIIIVIIITTTIRINKINNKKINKKRRGFTTKAKHVNGQSKRAGPTE
jgi:hypothetical protein